MSEWRDKLQPASFRGVAFHVESNDQSGGRRVELHEYPLRDEPYPEDLGRKAKTFTINAYVIGDDYMTKRDALIEALEKSGAGTLVHRYYGQMRVQAGEYRVSQTNSEGGKATFSITFYEAGAASVPTSVINTKKRVAIKSDAALDVILQQFVEGFKVQGLPSWVTEQAQSVISDLQSKLAPLGVLKASINEYISLPYGLAGLVIGLVSSLTSLTQFRSLFSFGNDLPKVPKTTPSRKQQSKNQDAIISLVRNTALVEAARDASNTHYDSAEQAINTRDELAEAIDDAMQTADDKTYVAMQDVRVALVNDMTVRAANLKRISRFTPLSTMPALVLAHNLYQDALKDNDIIDRNKIKHPGFVPGGSPLEVLNG